MRDLMREETQEPRAEAQPAWKKRRIRKVTVGCSVLIYCLITICKVGVAENEHNCLFSFNRGSNFASLALWTVVLLCFIRAVNC